MELNCNNTITGGTCQQQKIAKQVKRTKPVSKCQHPLRKKKNKRFKGSQASVQCHLQGPPPSSLNSLINSCLITSCHTGHPGGNTQNMGRICHLPWERDFSVTHFLNVLLIISFLLSAHPEWSHIHSPGTGPHTTTLPRVPQGI